MTILAEQIFSWVDIPILLFIFFFELLLSSDNAAAMAIIVKNLSVGNRKKALFAGLASAFLFRALGILFAIYLIRLFWMQILGGLYLIYLATDHLFLSKKLHEQKQGLSFWKSVALLELTDVIFAIDSILAAFALAGIYYPYQSLPHKLWVIYVGGILGIVTMRMATQKVLYWLDHYPNIERILFILVGWMGLKLIIEGVFSFFHFDIARMFLDYFFWAGSISLIVYAFYLSTKWRKNV